MKQSKSELTEAYRIVHWLIWYDDKFSCEFRRLDWLFTFLFHMVQCHFSHLEEEIFPSCGTYEIMMWTSCITWLFNEKLYYNYKVVCFCNKAIFNSRSRVLFFLNIYFNIFYIPPDTLLRLPQSYALQWEDFISLSVCNEYVTIVKRDLVLP